MITVESLVPYLAGALVLGGVAVALTRRRELMIRWCSWAAAVPVVTGLVWVGRPGAAALAIVVGVVAAVEFGALMRLGWIVEAILAIAVTGVVLTAWQAPEHVLRVVGVGMLAVAAVPILAGDTTHGLHRLSSGVLGVAWLSVLAALVPLGASALALFAAVSVADVVAYFAGPKLGGPRLSPLSPAKRWGGTLVGGRWPQHTGVALCPDLADDDRCGGRWTRRRPAGVNDQERASTGRTPAAGWPGQADCWTGSTR